MAYVFTKLPEEMALCLSHFKSIFALDENRVKFFAGLKGSLSSV